MPFIRIDEEYGDDEGVEPGKFSTGDFDYCTPEEYGSTAKAFKPADLTGVPAAAYAALRSLGIAQFFVTYDGGHDEGFAHAESFAMPGGTGRTLQETIRLLATPDVVKSIRRAAITGTHWHGGGDFYAKLSDEDVAKYAIDELADSIASVLLGDGYGTGEYSLYGRLTADLVSGKLEDDPTAPRPPDSTFD